MNCEKFLALDPLEQAKYIGQLVHVCQSSNDLFDAGKDLIEVGTIKGLFTNVKIGSDEIGECKPIEP